MSTSRKPIPRNPGHRSAKAKYRLQVRLQRSLAGVLESLSAMVANGVEPNDKSFQLAAGMIEVLTAACNFKLNAETKLPFVCSIAVDSIKRRTSETRSRNIRRRREILGDITPN